MVVKMWYYLWSLLKILRKQAMAAYCSSQLAYSRIVGCLKAVVQEGKIPSHLSLYETNFYNLAKKKGLKLLFLTVYVKKSSVALSVSLV